MYQNNLEHLLEELHRIDLIVRSNLKNGGTGQDADDFQGLYISEKEVNSILQTSPYEMTMNGISDQEIEKIRELASGINRKKNESINNGKELRLHILTEIFHLKPFEVDTILICLASELDMRYEKLYSYMQNDVTKKRPTVDLVIRLLCSSLEERIIARGFFSNVAPLFKNHLLYITDNVPEWQTPLLSKSIKVDERITDFLLGSDEIDRRLQNYSAIIIPERSFHDLILTEDHKKILMAVKGENIKTNMPFISFLHGHYGTGKKMSSEAICKELGKTLLIVDSKVLTKDDPLETLKLILREALLQKSCVYFEGFDSLWKDSGTAPVNLIRELDVFPGWVFLSGELPWTPPGVLKNHGFVDIAFPVPTFELRKMFWKSFMNGESVDIDDIAGKFKFSGGQIRDALFTARSIAAAKGSSSLSSDDLYKGCRAQSSRNLSSFARMIKPHYVWDDIVLPKDKKEQLREITIHIKNRENVYAIWGFDKKLSLGKGLNVLFSGPSGTGKTMAAEIIANESGLDIYKIDLSNVVSKYIGETEKNLSNIFREAENSNSILFFDEADALFGKRSEVKDAHDRYANIEIGYLLQKMEEYEGIVILATNLSGNIDDAFLRRMNFVVEFPFPDEKQRIQIWTGLLQKDPPLTEYLDYRFFSEKLKLAGGNIKNIAITAAFYAAEDSCKIGMNHIMRAAKREYQKVGKPFLKTDFEPYYKLAQTEEK